MKTCSLLLPFVPLFLLAKQKKPDLCLLVGSPHLSSFQSLGPVAFAPDVEEAYCLPLTYDPIKGSYTVLQDEEGIPLMPLKAVLSDESGLRRFITLTTTNGIFVWIGLNYLLGMSLFNFFQYLEDPSWETNWTNMIAQFKDWEKEFPDGEDGVNLAQMAKKLGMELRQMQANAINGAPLIFENPLIRFQIGGNSENPGFFEASGPVIELLKPFKWMISYRKTGTFFLTLRALGSLIPGIMSGNLLSFPISLAGTGITAASLFLPIPSNLIAIPLGIVPYEIFESFSGPTKFFLGPKKMQPHQRSPFEKQKTTGKPIPGILYVTPEELDSLQIFSQEFSFEDGILIEE